MILRNSIGPQLTHCSSAFLSTVIVVLLNACAAPEPARIALPPPTVSLDSESEEASRSTTAGVKEDDEWLSFEQMLDPSVYTPDSMPPTVTSGSSPAARQPANSPFHTIVLQTFAGDTSGFAAETWRSQLSTLVPPLEPDLRVHTNSKGSVVVFGAYEGWDDPQAAEDMASLKDIRVDRKKIFGAIIRTTIEPERDPTTIRPNELLSLRRQYPRARIIYTLEIEIWGDFDSGVLPDDVRRARAEERVQELRAAGTTAYFHHDLSSRLSTITVGAFDESAIDSSSGLPSRAVEMLQKKFPNRLINGEQLAIPIKGRSDMGAVPQRSRLVLVPEL
jgi:hypothetical protein